jgi:hypothetical protein
MTDSWLRTRGLLERYATVLVVLAVALPIAGCAVTYGTYVDPPTETERRVTATWTPNGTFQHQATVTQTNPLYAVGRTLSNRSVYYATVSPQFDGRYRLSTTGNASNVKGTVRLSLVLSGVDEGGNTGGETVLWQTTDALNRTQIDPGPDVDPVTVPFSLDLQRLANRTDRIERVLDGDAGEPKVRLVARVDLTANVGNDRVRHRETHALSLSRTGTRFSVVEAGNGTQTYRATKPVEVPAAGGPLRTIGGPLLLVFGLAGVGGVVLAHRGSVLSLSPAERERIEYLDDRTEFDEWISTIELPPEAFELPEAEAGSLGSLVDFAIDTENGVVESPDEAAFYVVHDGYLYSYRPPALASEGVVGRVDEETVGEAGRAVHEPTARAFGPESSAGGSGPESSAGEFERMDAEAFEADSGQGEFEDDSDSDGFEEGGAGSSEESTGEVDVDATAGDDVTDESADDEASAGVGREEAED